MAVAESPRWFAWPNGPITKNEQVSPAARMQNFRSKYKKGRRGIFFGVRGVYLGGKELFCQGKGLATKWPPIATANIGVFNPISVMVNAPIHKLTVKCIDLPTTLQVIFWKMRTNLRPLKVAKVDRCT